MNTWIKKKNLILKILYLILFNSTITNKIVQQSELIPKEIRDLTDQREKDIIKQEIIRAMQKKMQVQMKFNMINFML